MALNIFIFCQKSNRQIVFYKW